jgi:hypothetical protein
MKKMFLIALALLAVPVLHAEDWQKMLQETLPRLGHRNWIVITDAAYPWQVSEGIQTIVTNADQLDAIHAVLGALAKTKHVTTTIYVDQELAYVPEAAAPGISSYRDELAKILGPGGATPLPHEALISRLDEAGKVFHVLLLKTTMTIPYTSVFIQLQCGYWNADSEKQLRALIPAK